MEQDFPTENPLKRVGLVKERPGAPNTLDASGLQEFQERAQQASGGPEEPEEALDVPAPDLSPEEIAEMVHMKRYLQQQEVLEARFQSELKEAREAEERMQQISKRVSEASPLRLRDLIVQGYLRQSWAIDSEYVVEFQTFPSRVDLVIDDLSFELLKGHPNIDSGDPATRHQTKTYITQVLALVAGLREFSGKTFYAEKIRSCKPEEIREILREGYHEMLDYPTTLLSDLAGFQALFLVGVRKVINHTGYVGDQAKKS